MSFAHLLRASAAGGFVLVVSAAAGDVHAGKLIVLHAFAGMPDGQQPRGNLVEDSAGNLYGTTIVGGMKGCPDNPGCGTVFRIAPDGTESVLFLFDGKKRGGLPYAGLIADNAGNLYGTAEVGGDPGCDDGGGCGAVFKLAPGGAETIVHAFEWNADGAFPMAPLTADGNGNLFGTTTYGGLTTKYCDGYFGCGTVFRIAANGTETVLHRFTGAYTGTGDGAYPSARLWIDAVGDIYGTTTQGGANCDNGGCGTLFEIPAGGQEKVLYSFCNQQNCADGSQPFAGVIADSAGNLYGTTTFGGNMFCPEGCGILFELTAGGSYKVLHTFTDVTFGGADGAYPDGELTADAAANIYGTTYAGGDHGCGGGGCGSLFEFGQDGTLSVLYGFDRKPRGILPKGGLLLDAAGHFFGTTAGGGARCKGGAGCGTVFEFDRK